MTKSPNPRRSLSTRTYALPAAAGKSLVIVCENPNDIDRFSLALEPRRNSLVIFYADMSPGEMECFVLFVKDDAVQGVRCRLVHHRSNVCIDVQGCCDVRMTQPFLNYLRADSCRN